MIFNDQELFNDPENLKLILYFIMIVLLWPILWLAAIPFYFYGNTKHEDL